MNEQVDSRMSWEHKNAESVKERGQAKRQQVKSLEDQWSSNDRADSGRFGSRCLLCSCVIKQERDDDWWFVT